MARVGYAKLGQRIRLDAADDWTSIGSDRDEPRVLKTLAERNPGDTFVIVGRNTRGDLRELGFPPNVINPWDEFGDELAEMTKRVAERHGSSSGLGYEGKIALMKIYDSIILPYFRDLDALVLFAGPHGTSNAPIRMVRDVPGQEYTNPHDQYFYYASYLARGITVWREPDPVKREEVWLVPDVRNVIKARDLKWPHRHPLLAQYDLTYNTRHERYGDPRDPADCGFGESARWRESHVWTSADRYTGSGLEICGVVPQHIGELDTEWKTRNRFGLFINEADPRARPSRKDCLRDWVLPTRPDFVHGNWSDRSQRELGRSIAPLPSPAFYETLRSVTSTFTTPSSGSGWATAKPWEAFAAGTVCFFHPGYDTQGHIIPTLEQIRDGDPYDQPRGDDVSHLARWLRVTTPEQLNERVDVMNTSGSMWQWVVKTQRRLYDQAWEDLRYMRKIEERIH